MNKYTNKGFSLLELLLVVAVGAILILAGLSIYRNITNNTQNNEAVRLINVIKQEVTKVYQGQSTYGSTSLEPLLVNMDAIPASSLQGSNIVTPFASGADAVQVNGAGETFEITFGDVPQDACIRLFTTYTDDDKDFTGLSLRGATVTELTPAQANISCDSSGNNDMTWSFR